MESIQSRPPRPCEVGRPKGRRRKSRRKSHNFFKHLPHRHPRFAYPRPGGDRREEVYAALELLQALGLRQFAPSVTACPGCGRTTSTTFQELAERIQGYVRDKMPEWKKQYEGVENMTLAVMGCIVNGPGESKAANIGISLPGTGEEPSCPVYIDGQKFTTLKGNYQELSSAFQALVDDYVATKYPRRSASDAGAESVISRTQARS